MTFEILDIVKNRCTIDSSQTHVFFKDVVTGLIDVAIRDRSEERMHGVRKASDTGEQIQHGQSGR